ncbi:MAG: SH3 domain-containing protein [Pyrinomonadaceae bacterium]
MKHIFALGILLCALCLPVFAQGDSCFHAGWVTDRDPKGTNIRDTASLKGKVIGKIPKAATDGEQAMLEIIGYSNGWLKIRLAESVDGTIFFKGIGWISAKQVTANVETNTGKPAALYSLPKRSSRKVGAIPSETPINIVGFDCFGFKIVYKGKTGWLSTDDACGNPVTTCP